MTYVYPSIPDMSAGAEGKGKVCWCRWGVQPDGRVGVRLYVKAVVWEWFVVFVRSLWHSYVWVSYKTEKNA